MKESNNISHEFKDITWYRLSVTFLGKKNSTVMKSHPISIFQAIIKAVSSRTPAFSSLDNEDMPVFHIKDKRHSFKMRPQDTIRVDFLFFKQDLEEISLWRQNLVEYFSDPVFNKTVEILTIGEIEERNGCVLSAEIGEVPGHGEICLEFLTPLPFNPGKGKTRVSLSKQKFIALYEKRFSDLFGRSIVYEPGEDDFTMLPYYWRYTEIKHTAKSQPGTIQYINGTVGNLYIKGTWRNFLPFLIVGSEIHTGTKLANSQGYYRILPEAPPYFADIFPDSKALITIIRDVIENYDHAAEWLAQKEMYPFDEKVFAEKLCAEIKNDGYEPSPNTAFLIRQKDKKDRLVEQMNFRDLIVARYLVKTVYKVFDNIFEEESIGSRKGISRERAVEMVKTAAAEGYEYMVESDIEDFFPSVDLPELRRLLDYYFPSNDGVIKRLLEKLTGNGYILEGRFHERVKGLALGNPLSSCLANLYLDSFDEYIKAMDVRLIRYVDDFIIFCKSPRDVEAVLTKMHGMPMDLQGRVKELRKAFVKGSPDNAGELNNSCDLRGLIKKPLYIDDPFVFLSINGNVVFIKKNQILIDVVPLRRISEIIVTVNNILSAALIRQCIEHKVLLTIRLNNGYTIPVIKS